MGRPRTAKHPAPPPAEEESQEQPEQEPSFQLGNNQPSNQTISKAEMCRIAMSEGIDNPVDGVAFLKSRFGIDLPKPMWSSYIAQEKARQRKAAGGDAPVRHRTASPQPMGIPAGFGSDVKEIRALIEKTGGSDELRDLIGQLSGLMGKYGASGLGELIDAIS